MRLQLKAKNTKDLKAELVQVSKANPTSIIVHDVDWGNATATILDKQPSTDTIASESTYKLFGGFLKNGKVIKPTSQWMKRHNFVPVSH